MKRASRRLRTAIAVMLLASAGLWSGCVYLRLLALKQQLAAFDRHFAVASDVGIEITCRNPVLRADDVRWIGLTPEKVTPSEGGEAWDVRWVKALPPGAAEHPPFDILIELGFTADQLTRVRIPERYFAVMSKALLLDLLRSLGGAKVDRSARSVEARLAVARPDLPGIRTLLGRPTSERTDAGEKVLNYRYRPATPRRLARAAVFDMVLRFDGATGQLLRWQGQTPVGKVGFNFEPTTEASGKP